MVSNLQNYLAGRLGNDDADADVLRRALFLGTKTWAEIGLLAVVEQCRLVWHDLPEPPRFVAARWSRPDDVWSYGSLVPDSQGPPVALYRPSAWPADDSWTISYATSTSALITGTYAGGTVVPAVFSAASSRLSVSWPSRMGWRGNISVPAWTANSVIHVTSVPVYPVTGALEAVKRSQSLPLLLQKQQLLPAYHEAYAPDMKLAVLGAAIIKSAAS